MVAVASLLAGILVSRFILSPAQAAADAAPPESGLITVPIEQRVVASAVTMRADVNYDDAVPISIDASAGETRAVVTGVVPEVGTELNAASIALEVVGRPVIVLPGELPAYRTISPGMSGPDVLQLKTALAGLGIGVGNTESDVYDAAAAAGVAELYSRVGYTPPEPEVESTVADALDSANQARAELNEARATLRTARAGPDNVRRVELDNEIRASERELAEARTAGDAIGVGAAQDRLRLAQTQRDSELATPDVSSEEAAVKAAEQRVGQTDEQLELARTSALPPLPSSEVVFLGSLPRRVDSVSVKRGSVISGDVMSVSGSTVALQGTASRADSALLKVGMKAEFDLPDGITASAEITSIQRPGASSSPDSPDGSDDETDDSSGSDGQSGTGGVRVTFTPEDLSTAQIEAVKGSNVRVSVPISSTDGEVLAVPLAALTAGADGSARIEVADGEETTLIGVETGLSADGYVEILDSDEPITPGDLVVVGR